MATEVIMPQMGESIFEGTITKWLKKIGDTVQKDEPLFEISTDKVDAEIPSPVAGVLTEIKVEEGATVQINTVVALVGAAGECGCACQEGPACRREGACHCAYSEELRGRWRVGRCRYNSRSGSTNRRFWPRSGLATSPAGSQSQAGRKS